MTEVELQCLHTRDEKIANLEATIRSKQGIIGLLRWENNSLHREITRLHRTNEGLYYMIGDKNEEIIELRKELNT